MFMRTQRLFLRPPFPEDSRELHAALGHEEVVRMLASAPWPYTEDDAKGYCDADTSSESARFLITLPGANGSRIVGGMGFGPVGDGAAQMGYWIAPAHQGKGYATEAGRGVLSLARALGVERMLAGHFVDNPGSGRVLAKLGFVPTGEVRASACKGRGGAMVPVVRFACELAERHKVAA